MTDKRHKPEEMVPKLGQVEVLVGKGMPRVDAIPELRLTEQAFRQWRKQRALSATGPRTMASAVWKPTDLRNRSGFRRRPTGW